MSIKQIQATHFLSVKPRCLMQNVWVDNRNSMRVHARTFLRPTHFVFISISFVLSLLLAVFFLISMLSQSIDRYSVVLNYLIQLSLKNEILKLNLNMFKTYA